MLVLDSKNNLKTLRQLETSTGLLGEQAIKLTHNKHNHPHNQQYTYDARTKKFISRIMTMKTSVIAITMN